MFWVNKLLLSVVFEIRYQIGKNGTFVIFLIQMNGRL